MVTSRPGLARRDQPTQDPVLASGPASSFQRNHTLHAAALHPPTIVTVRCAHLLYVSRSAVCAPPPDSMGTVLPPRFPPLVGFRTARQFRLRHHRSSHRSAGSDAGRGRAGVQRRRGIERRRGYRRWIDPFLVVHGRGT